VVAAPITFNSINKWAAGTSDTLALGVLNEMLGTDVHIVVAPCVKPALRKHPAYHESIARLTRAGVSIMNPDAVTVRAEDGLATFEWTKILSTLSDALSSRPSTTVAHSG
jgi:phosphopantothenoylcysteine synthetase/decarboxylase